MGKLNPIVTLGMALLCQMTGLTATAGPSPRDIAQQAKAITVRIVGQDYSQTGVLVSQEGERYWVLTCDSLAEGDRHPAHIQLGDERAYKILDSRSSRLADALLAVLTFVSSHLYTTAQLGDSPVLAVGDRVYVAGFLDESNNSGSAFQFTEGIISSVTNPSPQEENGFTHTSLIYPGMEGSPIFDSGGKLIGLHCGSKPPLTSRDSRAALNWGIAINFFPDFAQKQGLPLGFSAFGSPPPDLIP